MCATCGSGTLLESETRNIKNDTTSCRVEAMPNIPTTVTTNISVPIEVIVFHIIEAAPRELFSPVFNIAVKCCNDSINCSFGESAHVCRHNKSDIDQIYITADLHTDFGCNDAGLQCTCRLSRVHHEHAWAY